MFALGNYQNSIYLVFSKRSFYHYNVRDLAQQRILGCQKTTFLGAVFLGSSVGVSKNRKSPNIAISLENCMRFVNSNSRRQIKKVRMTENAAYSYESSSIMLDHRTMALKLKDSLYFIRIDLCQVMHKTKISEWQCCFARHLGQKYLIIGYKKLTSIVIKDIRFLRYAHKKSIGTQTDNSRTLSIQEFVASGGLIVKRSFGQISKEALRAGSQADAQSKGPSMLKRVKGKIIWMAYFHVFYNDDTFEDIILLHWFCD